MFTNALFCMTVVENSRCLIGFGVRCSLSLFLSLFCVRCSLPVCLWFGHFRVVAQVLPGFVVLAFSCFVIALLFWCTWFCCQVLFTEALFCMTVVVYCFDGGVFCAVRVCDVRVCVCNCRFCNGCVLSCSACFSCFSCHFVFIVVSL